MASIKKQLLDAVGEALDVSAVTNLATGGVFQTKAGKDAVLPYVVFDIQGFSEIDYNFGLTVVIQQGILIVKAYADEDSNTTKAPQDLTDEILEACKTLLHGTGLSLETDDLLTLYEHALMPTTTETQSDRTVFGNGTMYRFVARPAA